MRTNYVLLAAVLLSLCMWGAAQFVTVSFDHPYWPTAAYRPDGPKVWHRDVGCWFDRGGVRLQRVVNDSGGFVDPRPKIVMVRAPKTNDPALCLPGASAGYGWYTLFLPYWLLALLPAAWLAWRLYRVRLNTRGFEVATA